MSLEENPISYLSLDEQRSIHAWAEPIRPLIEKYPRLQQIDLIVEGGVGNGETLSHITKLLFPNSLYVGTELVRSYGFGSRQSRAIDDNTLEKIVHENEHPTIPMRRAKMYANCFDGLLIRDILKKTSRANALLASYNALNGLLDRKMNPWESKNESDRVTVEDMVASNSPYVAQLHLGVEWEDKGKTSLSESYYELEAAARAAGWKTERVDIGLLLVGH